MASNGWFGGVCLSLIKSDYERKNAAKHAWAQIT